MVNKIFNSIYLTLDCLKIGVLIINFLLNLFSKEFFKFIYLINLLFTFSII